MIAGAGWAMAAWRMAQRLEHPLSGPPTDRWFAAKYPCIAPVSVCYYELLDAADARWQGRNKGART